MKMTEVEDLLVRKGVRPTSNRLLVLRELVNASHPVSLSDLECLLDTLDKTSIFRVLELFAEKDIVHAIEDGSRSVKYELCHGDAHHSIADQHVHFFCERCREVFCFEDVNVPLIDVPEGFQANSVNYMLKGLCPKCADK